MTLSSTARRLLAMVAPALMMGGFGQVVPNDPGQIVIDPKNTDRSGKPVQDRNRLADVSEARILRMFGMGRSALGGYRTGPGWSQAKVQRMARKKRNQAKNKRAHRG